MTEQPDVKVRAVRCFGIALCGSVERAQYLRFGASFRETSKIANR